MKAWERVEKTAELAAVHVVPAAGRRPIRRSGCGVAETWRFLGRAGTDAVRVARDARVVEAAWWLPVGEGRDGGFWPMWRA